MKNSLHIHVAVFSLSLVLSLSLSPSLPPSLSLPPQGGGVEKLPTIEELEVPVSHTTTTCCEVRPTDLFAPLQEIVPAVGGGLRRVISVEVLFAVDKDDSCDISEHSTAKDIVARKQSITRVSSLPSLYSSSPRSTVSPIHIPLHARLSSTQSSSLTYSPALSSSSPVSSVFSIPSMKLRQDFAAITESPETKATIATVVDPLAVVNRQSSTPSETIRVVSGSSEELLAKRRSSVPMVPSKLFNSTTSSGGGSGSDNSSNGMKASTPHLPDTEGEEPPLETCTVTEEPKLESTPPGPPRSRHEQQQPRARARTTSLTDIVLLASPVLIPALAAGIYVFGK